MKLPRELTASVSPAPHRRLEPGRSPPAYTSPVRDTRKTRTSPATPRSRAARASPGGRAPADEGELERAFLGGEGGEEEEEEHDDDANDEAELS